MTAFAVLCLALSIAFAAYRLTARPLAFRVEHIHEFAQPLTLHSDLATQWWTAARDVPDPAPAVTAEPARDDALDEAIDDAVAEGVRSLRALYGSVGRTATDAELEAEAREMVLAEFGT